MKNDDIGIIIDRLRYLIKEKNILAIHGPPVTECTSKIIQEVYNSAKNIPVFVTSAAPKKLIKWTEIRVKVPLFRISTGVDDRAGHIADFIDDVLIRDNYKNKMIFLVETNENGVQTFGEKFYAEVDELSKNLNKYRNNNNPKLNRIEVIEFYRNDLEALAKILETKGYLNEENIIYLLGVGSQYKFLVNRLYKIDNQTKPKAQFGGWMNSYAIDDKFREGGYHLDKLFEITDLFIDHSVPMNERQRNFQEVFKKKINPSLRDQAFSFDIGYVIYEAYNDLCIKHQSKLNPSNHLKLDKNLRTEIEQILGTKSFEGVSGAIGFDLNKGGTNQRGKLQYSRFNHSTNDWQVINYNEIFSK
jgi:predicted CoA-binding protein